ncbi:MOSC N-terminal beta barrel domain-containing protein [Robbsia sp. KACC 23696]|uniref:MOSC domain-containing protein n=1 Tax=Robbsia sp. KACC 23696 TaxID=3149231 RepID=UPI00325A7F46
MARLLSLHVYPIKSCRGIAVDSALLTPYGLAHDREWMVVHAEGTEAGTFISQRTHPALAWVVPRFVADGIVVEWDKAAYEAVLSRQASSARGPAAGGRADAIRAVCATPLLLPFTRDTQKTPSASDLDLGDVGPSAGADVRREVSVWRDTFSACDAGDAAAHWFSTLLGCAVRVVHFDPAVMRLASAEWTDGVDAPFTFADGFPFLVTNQASLDDLNARLQAKGAPPIPMDRFRANIVLDDLAAFEEDYVSALTLRWDPTDANGAGDTTITLKFVKPCARCPIPTFDQHTGRPDEAWPHEPLDTLTTYRMDSRVDGVTFGINAIAIGGTGQHMACGMLADTEIAFDD